MAPPPHKVGQKFPSAVYVSLYWQSRAIGSVVAGARTWRETGFPIGSCIAAGATVSDLDGSGLSAGDGAWLGLGAAEPNPTEGEGRPGDWPATGEELVQPASRMVAARTPVHLMFL
jgi:hypothetical protein